MYLFFSLFAQGILDLTSLETSRQVASQIPEDRPVSRAAAVVSNKHMLGVAFGQNYFFSDFSKWTEDELGYDFYYEYLASMSFGVMTNFHYISSRRGDNKLRVVGTDASIKVYFYHFDHFAPYFAGGVGFYHLALNDTHGNSFAFGNNLALGFDLVLNEHIKVGMLLHYHNPFDLRDQISGVNLEGSYFRALLLISYIFKS